MIKTKKFIYILYNKVKKRVIEWLIAPVKNYEHYIILRNLFINLIFTSLVCSFILWGFDIHKPIHKGSSIAVALAVGQFYIEWFYSIKK